MYFHTKTKLSELFTEVKRGRGEGKRRLGSQVSRFHLPDWTSRIMTRQQTVFLQTRVGRMSYEVEEERLREYYRVIWGVGVWEWGWSQLAPQSWNQTALLMEEFSGLWSEDRERRVWMSESLWGTSEEGEESWRCSWGSTKRAEASPPTHGQQQTGRLPLSSLDCITHERGQEGKQQERQQIQCIHNYRTVMYYIYLALYSSRLDFEIKQWV